ncbi:MAG TPA: alpha/beta fold hydrolase [Candidatus Dormibacteraeota bacterium]|nr:alpha/beta fold hydrolase [Candidatus Dormibacteraeota bacterium]
MISSVLNRPPKRLHAEVIQLGSLRVHHMCGGRGTPVLFIHGLGSSGYMEWRFNLEPAAIRHRVYAPDLPGFGRTEKPRARYGIAYFARFIERYMDDRGLRSAAVVGASLGGRIALELALERPKRVRKLVLVNALGLGRPKVQLSYGLLTLPRLGEAFMKVAGDAVRLAPRRVIRRVAARYVGAKGGDLKRTMDDDYFANLRELYAAEGYPDAYLATIRSLVTVKALMDDEHDLSKRLGEMKMPVQLIWGNNDPLFPIAHAASAHRLIPHSRLAVLEGAGHTPQAERPEEFNRVLENFLST